MAIILNIDTAIDNASISISTGGKLLGEVHNPRQREHATFIQPAIKQLCKATGIELKNMDAVAVSAGPGSYTGLRVGMASAKGLCYGLSKPLITISTLEIMAFECIAQKTGEGIGTSFLYCPMIDARRLEVFAAVYDNDLKMILFPCSMVLTPESFTNMMLKQQMIFFGNGATKWKNICEDPNAFFYSNTNNVLAMSKLSEKKFNLSEFANTAYAEPFYVKEFYTGTVE